MPDLPATATPQEAELVWNSQRRPSARSVAIALNQAGRPVHFTTVARWKRQGSPSAPARLPTAAAETAADAPEAGEADRDKRVPDLPAPGTPHEAKLVWERQPRPSARSVAGALTEAGRPVHFTTVARWKTDGWESRSRLEHPLTTAMRRVDLAVPVLTGDPTTKAEDIIGTRAATTEGMTEDQRLHQAIRESYITNIILYRAFRHQCGDLIPNNPAEAGVLIEALSKLFLATAKAHKQLFDLRRASGAGHR
jgi:hypothetical protein